MDPMEFRRVGELPPYVFAVIRELTLELRRAGEDVVDLGCGSGTLLAQFSPWAVLVLLVLVMVYTACRPEFGVVSGARMSAVAERRVAVLVGAVLGFYDGFFGPGAGSFWMLACVLTLGQDLRAATGTTKALNLTSNVASLIAFPSRDFVSASGYPAAEGPYTFTLLRGATVIQAR